MSKKDEKRAPDAARPYQCSDEVFVTDLGLPLPSQQATTALAIRSVIAEFAGVPATSICAHHTFSDDLAGGGMFDDSLDTVEFVMQLEDRLGRRIPNALAEKLPGLIELDFPHPLYSVSDLVTQMTRYLVEVGIISQQRL
jgi:acyl carrier protein